GGLSRLKPCRLAGIDEKLLCGQLTVPENRQCRVGRTIELNVVVLPAFDQKTKMEPLFDLAGGPGAAATEGARFYAQQGKEYRRRRDVVLVDQRGTGRSNPLRMPTKKTPQYYLSEMYPVDYVKTLRQTLEQRADLRQYTTSIAMDDLDDVRAWLGYERIHLLGTSYGTRAALVYMRLHPERVRTATLIGVAPTYLKMPTYHAQAGARAMDLLLQQCEQDAQCHAALPQIGDDWTNVLAQLARQTARMEYSVPDKSRPVMLEVPYRVFQQTRACSMWPQGKIPTDFREPVSSNIPVLIFSGNMDPVTPPQRGEEVARYLPNSRHVIIPQAGHGVEGLTEPECVDRISMEFMEKGDAKNLDFSCVERMVPPPFVTEAGDQKSDE